MFTATNFAIFTRAETKSFNLIQKKASLHKLLVNRADPPLTMSSYGSDLLLTLDRVIENTSLPIHLSNKLKSKLSLNVYNAKPFEVLFYITQFYQLRTINRNGKRLLLPKQEFLQ